MLLLISSGCLKSGIKDETPVVTTAPPITLPKNPTHVKGEYTNSSMGEICKIFQVDSKLTWEQKVEIFESQYRDKYVRWSGKLSDEVTELPSILIMNVNLTSSCDISVYFTDLGQIEILEALNTGDEVTFVASLNGNSEMPTLFAEDGELISNSGQ